MPHPTSKQRARSICSSTWLEAVRRGVAYPRGMIRCPVCCYDQPPIYFVAASDRCLDCSNGTDRTRLAHATPRPPSAKTHLAMKRLRDVLTRQEIKMLALYAFDRRSQGEIARMLRTQQTTISARLRRIMDKLDDAGLPIVRPERRSSKPNWMPDRIELVIVDPASLGTIHAAVDGDGRLRGRWSGNGQACRSNAAMNVADFAVASVGRVA